MAEPVLECFDPSDLSLDFFSRRSSPPGSFEEMKRSEYLILGHCTTSAFLEEIKRNGLVPDYHKGRSINDGLPSDPNYVYLFARLDKYFLKRAVRHHGGKGIVVAVQVELALLEADENAIAPADHGKFPSDFLLYKSLCMNQCRHRGQIRPNQILGIYLEDGIKIWPT